MSETLPYNCDACNAFIAEQGNCPDCERSHGPLPEDDCDHEWEYSDQSEPHKGREYFACRKCENVAITDGENTQIVPNYNTMRDDDPALLPNFGGVWEADDDLQEWGDREAFEDLE